MRQNLTYDELEVGQTAEIHRTCIADDLYVFAHASGNHNPLNLPEDEDGDGIPEGTAPAMWIGALISAVLGNVLPGPGTVYVSQSLEFSGRARVGDELVARVRVSAKRRGGLVRLETTVRRADGEVLVAGDATVRAPTVKKTFADHELPGLTVQRHAHFDRLIALAGPLEPIPTAVIAPEEVNSLGGAILGAEATLITPILIGDRGRIEAAARELGEDISRFEIVDVTGHDAAARQGVAMVAEGRARALMKGHLHTEQLLAAVLHREAGLRTGRRLSHVFVMDVPGLDHPLLVTDAAINIQPTLEEKVDIVQNAIDLGISIGIAEPKVGILSAVETVNPKIPSSIDAAILSKMAERGQITGGLVDGPLAMDNAVDVEAARTKGIRSAVAGRADVLVVPSIDAGNMLAKELTYIAHAEGAGIVLGAKVPIILTSRADDETARLASCAVAALHNARISGQGDA